jgi:cation transport regulator
MPYRSVRELPDAVKNNLPVEAQKQFLRVVNSALKDGDGEESAFKQAWSVIKKRFSKKNGKWIKKMSEPTYLVPFDFADKSLLFPFSKGKWFPNGEFTREDGEILVRNYKDNLLSRTDGKLAVNVEHDRSAGLVGYIVDVELTDEGVVGSYEWEDSAKAKKFGYVSAEINWEWDHPYNGTSHKNVLQGAALTNYPKLLNTAIARFSEDNGWEFAHTDEIPLEDSVWNLRSITDAMFMLRGLKQYKELKSDAQQALDAMKRLASNVVAVFAGDEETPGEDKEKESGRESNTSSQDFKQEDGMTMELDNEKVAQGLFERFWARFEKESAPKADPKPDKEQEDFSEQMTEMQTQLQALTDQMTAKETEIADLTKAKDEAEQKVQEYSDKIVEEENKRRLAEFAEAATEWGVPLDAMDFAETLKLFHDADETEDKKHYNRLVAIVEALRNQQAMAALFSEAGTDASGPASDEDK